MAGWQLKIKEAVAMAAITRHWTAMLDGMDVDFATFKRDTDAALQAAERARVVTPADAK